MIKYLIKISIIASILTWLSAYAHENPTKKEIAEIVKNLRWQKSGTYQIPRVFSSLTLPKDHQVLIGDDAQNLTNLSGGSPGMSVETVTINMNTGVVVTMGNMANGYTSLEDIEKINSSERLNAFREQMKKGFAREAVTVEWYQEPTLDKEAKTLSHSYEVQIGKQKIIMSTIFKYYRHGMLCFVSEIEKSKIDPLNNEIQIIADAYKFELGHRHIDYVQGDKIASPAPHMASPRKI